MLVIPRPFGGLYAVPGMTAQETDPFFANVVLLLHMDGADGSTTFVDSSPVGRTVSVIGNAEVDTGHAVFGGSAMFDGVNAALSCAQSNDFALPGDFTLEFFMRFRNHNRRTAISMWEGGLGVWMDDSVIAVARSGIADDLGTNWSPSTNTWYHVAVSRNSNTMRLFLNGSQIASGTVSVSYPARPCYIGSQDGGSRERFSGWIDELRLTKGVGRYTSNFTVPTTPYPDA